jgi:hypothetical protein
MRQTLISIAACVLLASQTRAAAADDTPAADVSAPPVPASAPSAAADPAKAECFTRHEEAQVARRQGRLLEARAWLRQCSSATCLGIVRADCIEWLAEVERAIPSIVITAHARSADLVDVKVIIDKQPVTARLTGAALDLDPGEHQLRFESPPWPAIERTILVSEGVKDRPIDVEFAPAAPAAPAAPVAPSPASLFNPPDRFDYVLAGTAAAGLATSVTFGIWALWSRSNLDGCAPFCTDEETNPVRAKLIVTDIALGVTVVSLAILFLHMRTSADTPPKHAGTPLVFASPTGGAGIGWGGAF